MGTIFLLVLIVQRCCSRRGEGDKKEVRKEVIIDTFGSGSGNCSFAHISCTSPIARYGISNIYDQYLGHNMPI